MKILLVEDDSNLAYLLQLHFKQERFLVDLVTNASQALAQLKAHTYELIVLDWMLPDLSGIEVCKQFRQSGGKTPVLMLTARGTIEDKAMGLDSGADDYLVKPFHPKELTARARALLRRQPNWEKQILQARDIELDTVNKRVLKSGNEVQLTAKELAIIELLMRHPNHSFSLEALLDRLWQSDANASIETVRTHMKTLRRKIGDNENDPLIQTKRGQGYRLNLQSH
jgi:DNA-binding response OmpR family regulator